MAALHIAASPAWTAALHIAGWMAALHIAPFLSSAAASC
jgi:hypothetical protein